jgi:CHAD domain-containing protein
MADGKWIDDVTADTPLDDAARRVLTVRLDVVRHYLPLALHEADKDPENVHQLRVSTRRARAALDIFSVCLPAKCAKTAKKHLRKIRRAAGDARDWDVFLDSLLQGEPKPAPRHRAGRDLLVGHALAQRAVAQEQLEAIAREEYPFIFDRVVAETVAAVQPAGDSNLQTLLDLAQPLLFGLVHEFTQAAAGPLDDYAHLHQVRIIGKRLRYAMEVFAECFVPSFRESVYPAVEEMQEVLGVANDSHVAVGRLGGILEGIDRLPDREKKRLAAGVTALRKYHAERLERQVGLFNDWWSRWQDSGGEAAFASLLRVPGARV